jgi:2-polyprenyl-3-methyl-5-hydroxy-6-metoxy-1,4-benzoquinol methylase
MKQKFDYLKTCMKKQLAGDGFSCPSCRHPDSTVIDRKYLVTSLRRCKHCQLLFRAPTTTSEENASFYQKEYTQGFTTDIPNEEQLRTYLSKDFLGTERDYSAYIDILRKASGSNGNSVFDFGCSWGYGSWQFRQNGFEVESFEISIPRAEFARNRLGVKAHTSLSTVSGLFDVVFSSHVLEHVPSVHKSIAFCFSILKPGGLFVAITPNGSADFRKKAPNSWHKLWGLVHPNFLDRDFYQSIFANTPYFIASNPYPIQDIENWGVNQYGCRIADQLSGDELLVIVKKE